MEMRRREMWWAVVKDDVQKGVPVSFRLHRYIGKTKPKKRLYPHATVIRGYVVAGEGQIGRRRCRSSTRSAICSGGPLKARGTQRCRTRFILLGSRWFR